MTFDLQKDRSMKQEVIIVQNLKCAGCVSTVAQVLGVFPEITDVKVDLETATVRITTKADDQREKYEASLRNAGYPPVGVDNPFHHKVGTMPTAPVRE